MSSREFSEWMAYYMLEPFGARPYAPPAAAPEPAGAPDLLQKVKTINRMFKGKDLTNGNAE